MWSTIIGLLPIILLVVWPILSSIFSGISSSTPSAPSMAFDAPHPPLYTMERTMPNFKVKYYLNPADIQSYSPSKLSTLDKKAEVLLVQQLRIKCENEMAHKQQLRNAAQGWFFPDPAKMELANDYQMEACRRLNSLGL
jgi:DnaJ family protein B protein 12